MDTLLRLINKYPNGAKLIIRWENGLEIEGKIDTIYETDNGLEVDEEGYKEYDACAFNVTAILNTILEKPNLEVGSLIEISMQDPPLEVYLEDGTLLWESDKKH